MLLNKLYEGAAASVVADSEDDSTLPLPGAVDERCRKAEEPVGPELQSL